MNNEKSKFKIGDFVKVPRHGHHGLNGVLEKNPHGIVVGFVERDYSIVELVQIVKTDGRTIEVFDHDAELVARA